MWLFTISVLFISALLFVVLFRIRKEHDRLILVGLGSSGLNVTSKWVEMGGLGFGLMENIFPNVGLKQYSTIDDVLKNMSLNRKYVIVSGLGGKSANLFLLNLVKSLEKKSISFSI